MVPKSQAEIPLSELEKKYATDSEEGNKSASSNDEGSEDGGGGDDEEYDEEESEDEELISALEWVDFRDGKLLAAVRLTDKIDARAK